MDKTQNKSFIIKLALILFGIVFIATLLLTVCNYITKDRIAYLESQTAEEAKQAVIDNAEFTEVVLDEKIKNMHLIGSRSVRCIFR